MQQPSAVSTFAGSGADQSPDPQLSNGNWHATEKNNFPCAMRSLSTIPNPSSSFNGCARWTNSERFQNSILIAIVLNSAWIGFDIEYNPEYQQSTPFPKAVFTTGDHVFTTIFLIEILMRFFSCTKWRLFFTEPSTRAWNWFDFILVIMMMTESWFIPLVLFMLGYSDEVQVPKALQLLRLLRLLRITRIFQLLPELGMMVKSMLAALRSVSSTFTLAVCIMYVFSIIFTGWFLALGNSEEDQCVIMKDFDNTELKVCFNAYFGTIPFSLMTCFQLLIFDDTFALIRPVFEKSVLIGSLLIVFLSLAAFTVLNMLIGVICEIVGTTVVEEKEKVLKARVIRAFNDIDCDASGTIDRAEFDNAARKLLIPLGLDESLVTKAFDVIDKDASGELELSEFIATVFKMLHPPQSADLLLVNRKVDKLAEYLGFGNFKKSPWAAAPKDRQSSETNEHNKEKNVPRASSKYEFLLSSRAIHTDATESTEEKQALTPSSSLPHRADNSDAVPATSSSPSSRFRTQSTNQSISSQYKDFKDLKQRKISERDASGADGPLPSVTITIMSQLQALVEQQARILAHVEGRTADHNSERFSTRRQFGNSNSEIMVPLGGAEDRAEPRSRSVGKLVFEPEECSMESRNFTCQTARSSSHPKEVAREDNSLVSLPRVSRPIQSNKHNQGGTRTNSRVLL